MTYILPQNYKKILAIVLASMAIAGCSTSQGSEAPGGMPPTVVEVAKASSDTVSDESQYMARFESRKSITLAPRVGGIVKSIETSAGQAVTGGQVLIRIEASQQEAAVRSAAAGIESRSTNIEQARASLLSLEADKIARESNVKLTKIQLDRTRSLHGKGVVSRQELDIAENNYDTAVSSLGAMNAQIQAQKAVILQTQKDVKQAGEMLSEQRAQLRYYDVSAPFTGVVGDIPVKVGDYVSPTSQLMTITVNQPLEAYIYVPIEKSSIVRTGMSVQLTSPDGRDLGPSRIFFVAPGAEGNDQTLLVKAEYGNGDGSVRSGETGQARITWAQNSGLWVPATAVSQIAGQQFVFVAKHENGQWTAHQVPVKLGEPDNSRFPVIEGLTADDEIIVGGTSNLFDKMPIAIKGRADQLQ